MTAADLAAELHDPEHVLDVHAWSLRYCVPPIAPVEARAALEAAEHRVRDVRAQIELARQGATA